MTLRLKVNFFKKKKKKKHLSPIMLNFIIIIIVIISGPRNFKMKKSNCVYKGYTRHIEIGWDRLR